MINSLKKTESGFVQLVVLGVMALSILSISVATNLVQKNQENRSKAAEGESVSMLTLNEKAIALGVGQTYQLRAFLGSVDVTNSVTWSSDGTGISTVSQSGLVTMLMENAGNNVTAKTADGKEAVAQIFGQHSLDRVDAICGTANGKTYSSLLLESDATSFFCKESVAAVVTKKSENIYSWTCVGANGGVNANCSATIDPTANTAKASLSATEVSMYYGFRDRNDYRTLGVGMTIVSTIRLYTGGKGISLAKIVYNHTDKLSPILNEVTGDQLASVVSHKDLGNGFNELVVNFDKSKKLTDGIAYEIKIVTKIIKLGKGTLSFNTSNSLVYGLNNEVVPFSNTISGTDFDIGNLSPTPTTSTALKPRLYFEVTRATYSVGENIEVSVSVDSASKKIEGVDVVGNYDASKLELISVKQSESFVFNGIGECVVSNSSLGKFIATCYIKDSINDRPALGKLLTLVFKAKTVGRADFSFDCVNRSTLDSNILSNTEDVIACDQNMQMHLVVMPNDNSITPTITPIPIKGSKMDGKCGTTKNSCITGGLVDITDSSLNYMWKCKGVNGGTTKVCSLKRNVGIDGKCGTTKNSCIAGKVDPLYGTLRSDRWRCLGINGGKTISCLTWK